MYRYYSNPTNRRRVTVVGKYESGLLKLATSCCSTKDQFMKKKGRAIAEGRLAKEKLIDVYELDKCDIRDFLEIAKILAAKVAVTKEVVSKDSFIYEENQAFNVL